MRTLSYYATYLNDTSESPAGMIVVDKGYDSQRVWRYQAMYWHSDMQKWIYDPATVSRLLGSDEYWEFRRKVDRPTAEAMTLILTGEPLPSEQQISEMFRTNEAS